jgi:hypothetical protein
MNSILKEEIEKKSIKKKNTKKSHESTQVNRPNSWSKSWDRDNLIENKPKYIMNPNSQST